MKLLVFLFITYLTIFSGCSAPKIAPVAIDSQQENISYLHDVKPILDKRCVSCHSCYNSPCQSKLSSFEGVDRGASKIEVYNATRLNSIDPTRLFIDAQTSEQWREKEFYSLTKSDESNTTNNDSIMMHLLYNKKINPDIIGDYDPEHDKLSCPKDKQELEAYIDEKPNHGMPYGFPQISQREYKTLSVWLQQGATGPTPQEQLKLTTPSKNAALEIKKWETFLNKDDAKHQMTARYLYEHIYLAHIYFPNARNEYYELIRSYTPAPQETKIIPTFRPFDDPKVEKFYYRFRKIHSTIVHKTHMVFKFDDSVLKRFKEIFITPEWDEKPHKVSYDIAIAANPFIAFRQIPPHSRYQFLLNNAHYIIMTFIRGPVCRGQMSLNVIQDHFWVMFKDPNADVSVRYPEFLNSQADNLSLPIYKVDEKIIKTFSDEYREKYEHYYEAKKEIINRKYPHGYGIESIWKGERPQDAPALTIYRHFDSASVHKGILGSQPRTMWVIDYPQFERIYYSLVAGYDVFGNISHQTNIRRYMDFLRIEGELNFLQYMPRGKRMTMLKSWYIGDNQIDNAKYLSIDTLPSGIQFESKYSKHEFLQTLTEKHFLKSTQIQFDHMNYLAPQEPMPKMPHQFQNLSDFTEAVRSLTLPGTGFITSMTDHGANNILIRVDLDDGTHIVKNLVINRWHNNVNSLFNGEEVLDPSKDSMDILDPNIGSYPNVFVIIQQKDLKRFIYLMKNMSGTDEEYKELQSYFVSRSNPEFWKIFDWFNDYFYKIDPINAGLYDLNRYARTPWEVTQ
jgi:Fatty acid cis/trans isomerase (CTI)